MTKKSINNNCKSYEHYFVPVNAVFNKLNLEDSSIDVFMYSTSLSDLVDSMNKELAKDKVGIQVTPNFISQKIYKNEVKGFDFVKGTDFYEVVLSSIDSFLDLFNAVLQQKDRSYILRIIDVDSHNELMKKLI